LVEIPADGQAALSLIADDRLVPPVALLIYNQEDPTKSFFYPQTEFSPEWNAIRHCLRKGIEVRAFDLPVGNRSWEPSEEPTEDSSNQEEETDPFAMIAEASGYPDGETWWEHLVEARKDATDVFTAVQELMTALRETAPSHNRASNERREAHMRLAIRRAEGDGFQRIAVVCGAWHGPALEKKIPVSADQAILKGLPKAKTLATWAPYTYERVSTSSGYGAGVTSPGYYHHLWNSQPEEVVSGWLVKCAHTLREEGFDASTASVIEAVRLSDALAAVRDRSGPGLREMTEAARTVLTAGYDEPLKVIHRKLIVGERLGEVPTDAPTAPLQADLEATQKRLRLKPEALERTLELDLRGENDLARSHLLHRLLLLDIPWGRVQTIGRKAGTFHEVWKLRWQPELIVSVIVASQWGGSVLDAACGRAVELAHEIDNLPGLTTLAHDVLLAALGRVIPATMARLEEVAAASTDAIALMTSLPPLGQVMRYGDVRKTDVEAVTHVFESIFVRACAGLPPACAGLDDQAAAKLLTAIDATHAIVSLLSDEDRKSLWYESLQTCAERSDAHQLIAGRAFRLLFDGGIYPIETVVQGLSRAGSRASDGLAAAAWIEGFLGQSAVILLHQEQLWSVLDEWVTGLEDESFIQVLPLLRRTFSTFSKPELRQLAERVSGGLSNNPVDTSEVDLIRAMKPLPIIRLMLGIESPPQGEPV
jgi:hypothetical protein